MTFLAFTASSHFECIYSLLFDKSSSFNPLLPTVASKITHSDFTLFCYPATKNMSSSLLASLFLSLFLWAFSSLSQVLILLKTQNPRKYLHTGMYFKCPAGDCYCFSCLVPLGYFHRSPPLSQIIQCCLHSWMKTEGITNISWTIAMD